MYADTDFFIALVKDGDWLNKNAVKIYGKYKNSIWTSTVTLQELLIIAYRESRDPTAAINLAHSFADIRDTMLGINELMQAAEIMQKYKTTPFDALHAVLCGDDTIISSDKIFDEIGLKRIKLEEHL